MTTEASSPAQFRYTVVAFRRAAFLAAGSGGAAVIVLALLGRPLLGLLGCLGLALGAANGYLMHRSMLGLASSAAFGTVSKKRVAMSSLSRLAAITAVAVVFAVLIRPDGVAVFFGLAFFQIVVTGAALVPGLKGATKA